MKKIRIVASLLVLSLCVLPAAALVLADEPEMIYEGKAGYGLCAVTDGKYILIGEEQPNPVFNQRIEGYQFVGTLYLYTIAEKTLSEIPGNIPPDMNYFTVVDDVVFWQSAPYWEYPKEGGEKITSSVYQYTIGDAAPKKLDIGSFADTDGVRMVQIQGMQMHPENIKIEVYDLRTGETTAVPASENVGIGTVRISGDLVVWSENRPTGNGMIYIYNLSSGTMSTLGKEKEEFFTVLDLTGDTLTYIQNTHRKFNEGFNEIRSVNLTTNETRVFANQPMRYTLSVTPPLIAWSVYPDYSAENPQRPVYVSSFTNSGEPVFLAENGMVESVANGVVVWSGWNESTDFQQTISMAILTGDEIDSSPSRDVQTPQTTAAEVPLNITVGSIAFAVACLFAILWRKK